jgi:hypothetical protein
MRSDSVVPAIDQAENDLAAACTAASQPASPRVVHAAAADLKERVEVRVRRVGTYTYVSAINNNQSIAQ